MIRATQPPHRCLYHLIILMVRKIETVTTELQARDLKISQKEMRIFATIGAMHKIK